MANMLTDLSTFSTSLSKLEAIIFAGSKGLLHLAIFGCVQLADDDDGDGAYLKYKPDN